MRHALVVVGLSALGASGACSNGHTTVVTVPSDGGASSEGGAVDGGPPTPVGCIRGSGQPASKTIGHGGGDITLEGLVLHVEPDTIATDTLVTVTSSVACPGDTTLASETPIYEITPAGLPLSMPASVSITYGGGSHGAMLFATTSAGDLGFLATSTERNEVHGALAELGAVWVASYPAVAPFNAAIVPGLADPGTHATLLLGNDADFAKTDCTVDQGVGPVTWSFVFDAAKQDYVPRAAIDVTAPATYTVTCPTAKLTASAALAARPAPEVSFSVAAGQLSWTASSFAKCTLDGAAVAVTGTQPAAAGVHALVCYDAAGVRVSRWARAAAH